MNYYTTEQVAEKLSISCYTVRCLAHAGYFGNVFHPGKRWIFTDDNIEEYLRTPPKEKMTKPEPQRKREVHRL